MPSDDDQPQPKRKKLNKVRHDLVKNPDVLLEQPVEVDWDAEGIFKGVVSQFVPDLKPKMPWLIEYEDGDEEHGYFSPSLDTFYVHQGQRPVKWPRGKPSFDALFRGSQRSAPVSSSLRGLSSTGNGTTSTAPSAEPSPRTQATPPASAAPSPSKPPKAPTPPPKKATQPQRPLSASAKPRPQAAAAADATARASKAAAAAVKAVAAVTNQSLQAARNGVTQPQRPAPPLTTPTAAAPDLQQPSRLPAVQPIKRTKLTETAAKPHFPPKSPPAPDNPLPATRPRAPLATPSAKAPPAPTTSLQTTSLSAPLIRRPIKLAATRTLASTPSAPQPSDAKTNGTADAAPASPSSQPSTSMALPPIMALGSARQLPSAGSAPAAVTPAPAKVTDFSRTGGAKVRPAAAPTPAAVENARMLQFKNSLQCLQGTSKSKIASVAEEGLACARDAGAAKAMRVILERLKEESVTSRQLSVCYVLDNILSKVHKQGADDWMVAAAKEVVSKVAASFRDLIDTVVRSPEACEKLQRLFDTWSKRGTFAVCGYQGEFDKATAKLRELLVKLRPERTLLVPYPPASATHFSVRGRRIPIEDPWGTFARPGAVPGVGLLLVEAPMEWDDNWDDPKAERLTWAKYLQLHPEEGAPDELAPMPAELKRRQAQQQAALLEQQQQQLSQLSQQLQQQQQQPPLLWYPPPPPAAAAAAVAASPAAGAAGEVGVREEGEVDEFAVGDEAVPLVENTWDYVDEEFDEGPPPAPRRETNLRSDRSQPYTPEDTSPDWHSVVGDEAVAGGSADASPAFALGMAPQASLQQPQGAGASALHGASSLGIPGLGGAVTVAPSWRQQQQQQQAPLYYPPPPGTAATLPPGLAVPAEVAPAGVYPQQQAGPAALSFVQQSLQQSLAAAGSDTGISGEAARMVTQQLAAVYQHTGQPAPSLQQLGLPAAAAQPQAELQGWGSGGAAGPLRQPAAALGAPWRPAQQQHTPGGVGFTPQAQVLVQQQQPSAASAPMPVPSEGTTSAPVGLQLLSAQQMASMKQQRMQQPKRAAAAAAPQPYPPLPPPTQPPLPEESPGASPPPPLPPSPAPPPLPQSPSPPPLPPGDPQPPLPQPPLPDDHAPPLPPPMPPLPKKSSIKEEAENFFASPPLPAYEPCSLLAARGLHR